jgi:NAD(P)-dependent dehydrogenase (short-subunit alcohol dehydrogenase family)
MGEGASIINTTSINADKPNQQLLAYATTKGAIHNFTAGLAQMLAERNIRVNAVAPGPVWTPLILHHAARGGEELRPADPDGPRCSPPNWPRPTSCWRAARPATSAARPFPSPAAPLPLIPKRRSDDPWLPSPMTWSRRSSSPD